MKRLKIALAVTTAFIALLAVSTIIGNKQPVAPVQAVQTPIVRTIPTPQQLLDETNEIRKENGVPPLKLDERLNKSAQLKLQSLVKEGGLSHADITGKHGYEYISQNMPECTYISENLAENYIDAPIRGFATSKPHWDAVNNARYDYIGFADNKERLVMHFCDVD
jgi:uncharacterized protein YkwD